MEDKDIGSVAATRHPSLRQRLRQRRGAQRSTETILALIIRKTSRFYLFIYAVVGHRSQDVTLTPYLFEATDLAH